MAWRITPAALADGATDLSSWPNSINSTPNTNSPGHTDTDTTTGSYLHAFDYLQEVRLKEVLAAHSEDGVTAAQIGGLLGIKRAAVLASLKQLPAAEREGWRRGERPLYPWTTVVRLLA